MIAAQILLDFSFHIMDVLQVQVVVMLQQMVLLFLPVELLYLVFHLQEL